MPPRRRFLSDSEAVVVSGFRTLADGNPFLPERIEGERRALGDAHVEGAEVWHVDADLLGLNPNIPRLAAVAEGLVDELRERLAAGASATHDELAGYDALVRYRLFARYEHDFFQLLFDEAAGGSSTRAVPAFRRFAADVDAWLAIPGVELPHPPDASHVFAWGYQIRRAFHHIYRQIYGGSRPAAELRADVWRSIFTHDPDRYRRVLFDRMGDVPTLILGDSGTGKELVARAIGLSRYIPFDTTKEAFVAPSAAHFHTVNLSALTPTLIESELFGHRRGSFTGAIDDRVGWFEHCAPLGTIFLDEIGELDPLVQVKLLRVLQERVFQRVGETEDRAFRGKLIAATNRDLEREMAAGTFRRDFYYRLCADVVRTPPLRAQIANAPSELHNLVLILARRIVGDADGVALADEVVAWIEQNLGLDYPWPGNIRELEQCLRNVMIRGSYTPPAPEPTTNGGAAALFRDDMTADELLAAHCTRTYFLAGSYEEAARRLGLDRRTVKAKVDPALLARLRARSA